MKSNEALLNEVKYIILMYNNNKKLLFNTK